MIDAEEKQPEAAKPEKRFWRDYEPTEKFNLLIATFTIVYSVITLAQCGIARQTMINSQKAFVYCKEMYIVGGSPEPGKSAGKPAYVVMDLFNSADTPARMVSIAANFRIGPSGVPAGFAYPLDRPQSTFPLAPKSPGQASFPISETTLNDLEAGRTKMIVYGEATYQDVFDTWHKTRFCKSYSGYVLKEDDRTIDKHLFNSCPEYNCYDEDCSR